jgi:tRNA(fMet)-specific endonuclease VapC
MLGAPIQITLLTDTGPPVNKKASPKMADIVSEFIERPDGVIAWDKLAVEHSILIKKELESVGTLIHRS